LEATIDQYIPREAMEEQWDVPGLESVLATEFRLELPLAQWLDQEKQLNQDGLRQRIIERAQEQYQAKVERVGVDAMRRYESGIMLHSLDVHWREHLAVLDHLRQGIHLRGYAQKNPKQEYKREAFELFSSMLDSIKLEVTRVLMLVQVRSEEEMARDAAAEAAAVANVQYHHADYEEALAQPAKKAVPQQWNSGVKVGRNDPCPCGSGRKYKQCHGQLG
jgi:preprotein translocase subunit SecA